MKFMVSWKILPGNHKQATEIFLSTGAPPPEGVTSLARWHAPGSACGWQLLETSDGTEMAQYMAEWANLLELQITPVIEDEEAAKGLAKGYGI